MSKRFDFSIFNVLVLVVLSQFDILGFAVVGPSLIHVSCYFSNMFRVSFWAFALNLEMNMMNHSTIRACSSLMMEV